MYADDNLRVRRFQKGLSVPRLKLSGERVSDAEFLDGARDVLARARRLWNEADKSDVPRYGFET